MFNRLHQFLILALVSILLFAANSLVASALPIICYPPPEGDSSNFEEWTCVVGITGGGVVATATGDAHVSLFGTRLEVGGQQEAGPPLGAVHWTDPGAGLEFASVTVTHYGWVPDQEQAREIRGTMSLNGSGAYPFVLRAVDAGPPGSGEDTVALTVGDNVAVGEEPTGVDYIASGPLVGGDVELLLPAPPETDAP